MYMVFSSFTLLGLLYEFFVNSCDSQIWRYIKSLQSMVQKKVKGCCFYTSFLSARSHLKSVLSKVMFTEINMPESKMIDCYEEIWKTSKTSQGKEPHYDHETMNNSLQPSDAI